MPACCLPEQTGRQVGNKPPRWLQFPSSGGVPARAGWYSGTCLLQAGLERAAEASRKEGQRVKGHAGTVWLHHADRVVIPAYAGMYL